MNNFLNSALGHAACQYRVTLPATRIKCDHRHSRQGFTECAAGSCADCTDNVEPAAPVAAEEPADDYVKYIEQLRGFARNESRRLKRQMYIESYGAQGVRIYEAEEQADAAQREALERQDAPDADAPPGALDPLQYQIMLARAQIRVASPDDARYAELLRMVLARVPLEQLFPAGVAVPSDALEKRTLALATLHQRIQGETRARVEQLDAFKTRGAFFEQLLQLALTRERLEFGSAVDAALEPSRRRALTATAVAPTDSNEGAIPAAKPRYSKKTRRVRASSTLAVVDTVNEQAVVAGVTATMTDPGHPTVPKETRRETRSFQRVLADLREKEEAIRNRPSFKSRQIPASSLNSSYALIMERMKAKSLKVRQERAAALREAVQPFSFTALPSYTKRAATAPPPQPQARPKSAAPANIRTALADAAAESGRQRRARAEELAKTAGLTDEHTFAPHVNHTVPDFGALQAAFKRRLEQARAAYAAQVEQEAPVPFSFCDRPPSPRRTSRPATADTLRCSPPSPVRTKIPDARPPLPSKTTRSVELRADKRHFELEKARLVQSAIDAEILRRQTKVSNVAARIRAALQERDAQLAEAVFARQQARREGKC